MSINLQRSPRQTQFWKDQTPLQVGPGSYLPGEQDAFNRQHMAPFNTSAYRKFGHRNENPGPGSYDWKKDKKPNEDLENKFQMPTKNFASKAARMAPVIPGSSIYKESTILENPAPGTYHQEKKWNRKNSVDRTRDKLNQTKHKDFVLECAAVPPSIPNRKVPNNSFTGKGLDRPGPTDYEPKDKGLKLRSPETNFSISKTERKLFEPNKTRENNLPPRQIPGPGTYQGERQKSFNFNSTGQNFTFLSKSPNCQQIKTDPQSYPGPGCYEHQKDQSPNPKVAEAEIPSFLSNTIRQGMWTYDAEAPFTKPDRMGVPGPGQYSVGKKYEDLKTKILLQEAIRAPFNSSGLRECMKGIKTSAEPGPGEYIDPNNTRYSSFYKSLLKNAYERAPLDQVGIKTGAFGSNQKRFEKSVFDGKAGPGPGQYEQVKEFDGTFIQPGSGEEQEKKKPSFEFKSTQARFKQRQKVKTQDSLTYRAPDVGVYNPHKNEWVSQTRSKEYSVFGGRSIGFDTTATRAKRSQSFFGHMISENPGPGNYESVSKISGKPASLPRNKNLQWGVVFNSCESRFKPGTNSYHLNMGTQKNVGPGSYIQTQNSMLKKSFNMTMEHSYFL